MFRSLRVALFLATRYLTYTNKWTTILVIFVMVLTFLNLVAVTGVLRGFSEGTEIAYKNEYSGDILMSPLPEREYIEQTSHIISVTESIPAVKTISKRYMETAVIEADYRNPKTGRNEKYDRVQAEIVGINPVSEDSITGIADFIVEGEYLNPGEDGYIVIGSDLIERYSPIEFAGFDTISGVKPGDKVRVYIAGAKKEMTIKGILDVKTRPTSRRAYITDTEMRRIIGRSDFNVDEISLLLYPGADPNIVKNVLDANGIGAYALVRTSSEAQGQLIDDLRETFAILENVIGGIGLLVAAITVFVVIFITAITRERYIGILKGLGINAGSIELSYVFLSFFYAVIGILVGSAFLYGFLEPYFRIYPIEYPFNYGSIEITTVGVVIKSALILLGAIIAGYIPTLVIVKRNTLDAILGR